MLGPIGRTGLSDAILLALIVFAMAFPLISIRGFHYEEGLTAALAKDALSGSPWYVPDLFGARWVERPVLQSWIVAAISWPLGGVTQFTTRLPGVVALYAGALIIVQLVRPRASRAAALVAALCFLFSPAVLQKVITAEADVILSVFEFAAFVVWWRGFESGRIGIGRWLAIGLLLAATALFKGPQPAAYFALGIGAFILVRRDWRQVPGYALAGIVSLAILASWYVAVYQAADTGTLLMYMRLSSRDTLSDYLFFEAQIRRCAADLPARPADRRADPSRHGAAARDGRHRTAQPDAAAGAGSLCRDSDAGAAGLAGGGDALCDAGPAGGRGDRRARLRPAAGAADRHCARRAGNPGGAGRLPDRLGLDRRAAVARHVPPQPHRCPDRRGGDARKTLHDLCAAQARRRHTRLSRQAGPLFAGERTADGRRALLSAGASLRRSPGSRPPIPTLRSSATRRCGGRVLRSTRCSRPDRKVAQSRPSTPVFRPSSS